MKLRNFVQYVVPFVPALISAITCIAIIFGLHTWLPVDTLTQDKLSTLLLVISFISILLVVVILMFILTKTNQLRNNGSFLNKELSSLTQKVHHFRNIVDLLVRSKVWSPGLKEYIDEEFGDLNFFMMKEFYKGRSKLAVEYIQENNRYGDSESLYLEAKSVLLTDPSNSKIDTFINPRNYSTRILKKWVEHKVGSGLWHFFGYKYASFKDELDVNRIFERHQDKILSYAIQLDLHRYQEMGFSEELLSKIGEQMSEDVFPRLLTLTLQMRQKVPRIINAAYALLVLLVIFGIFQPLVAFLFVLPVILSYMSIGIVVSLLLFIMLSVYPFVLSEINTKVRD
jgi:hypothetical protein